MLGEHATQQHLEFVIDTATIHRIACRIGGAQIDYTHLSGDPLRPPTLFDGLPVASLEDITAMKVAAVTHRGAVRDWYDLQIIQERTGWGHRDCYMLYRERYLGTVGPHQAALVADTLCKWYPGMAGLIPDPHLRDIHGNAIEPQTRRYWQTQYGALHEQLSRFKRRDARVTAPGIRQGVLGQPQQPEANTIDPL